jgi:hypothetical protein
MRNDYIRWAFEAAVEIVMLTVMWLLTQPELDTGLGVGFTINFVIDWLLLDPAIVCLCYYLASQSPEKLLKALYLIQFKGFLDNFAQARWLDDRLAERPQPLG